MSTRYTEPLAQILFDRIVYDVEKKFPGASLRLIGHGGMIWLVVVLGTGEERLAILGEVREVVSKINREKDRGFTLWATTS